MTSAAIAERTKGFTHVIIATLPQHITKLRTTYPDYHVVSILDLLTEVRT